MRRTPCSEESQAPAIRLVPCLALTALVAGCPAVPATQATCPAGQIQVSNGTGWDCKAPSSPTQATCPAGQIQVSTGAGWECKAPSSPTQTTCPAGQIQVSNGAGWDCKAPSSLEQPLSLPACADGQLLGATADGGWECLTLGAGVTVTDGGVIAVASMTPATACPAGSVSRWDGSQWACDSLASEAYDCPAGYTRNSETQWVACAKMLAGGQVDEVVKVGDFWIDRFEMSTCGSTDEQAPTTGPDTGYGTTAKGCSVSGVIPTTSIDWFQAAQMCANEGKHLCTNAEWQEAVSGTSDPGQWPAACPATPTPPGAGPCNTYCGSPRETGLGGAAAGGSCYSSFGAEDMIGNVDEWVADWGQSGPSWEMMGAVTSSGMHPWPASFGDGNDATVNVNGSVLSGDGSSAAAVNGLPAAMARGGGTTSGTWGGAFTVEMQFAPSLNTENAAMGARCCLGGR